MSKALGAAYLKALSMVNLRDLSKETGRGYSTLMAYKDGTRRVTEDAGRELAAYLRRRAGLLTKAAEKLDAVLADEGRRNG